MNETEIERIASAVNRLRPDWPATSLVTLIRKHFGDRPRRDVAVAFAWVACEAESKTPARILENGPWWKAAAVETSNHGALAHRGPWCKNCYQGETAPIHASGECSFTLWPAQAIARDRRREIVAQMRADMAANPSPAVLQPTATDDGPCGIDGCIRSSAHTEPHEGPPPEATTRPIPIPPPIEDDDQESESA